MEPADLQPDCAGRRGTARSHDKLISRPGGWGRSCDSREWLAVRPGEPSRMKSGSTAFETYLHVYGCFIAAAGNRSRSVVSAIIKWDVFRVEWAVEKN